MTYRREEIVSDTSQGPGWWQASDGKWYSPEQHPDYRPPPPSPPTETIDPTSGPDSSAQALVQLPLQQPQPVQPFQQPMVVGKVGMVRKPIVVILLSIITFGIYYIFWQYVMFKEMNEYSGQGVGGVVGLIFALLLSIVNIFLLPSEVGQLYGREGQQEPVTGVTGFWVFLPLVGWFVWFVKVQRRVNEFWIAHGAAPAA